MQTEMDQDGDANGGDWDQDMHPEWDRSEVAADMHLTSLQLSNQRTSQNINTSSNQNHFRISNQFGDACSLQRLTQAPCPAAACDSCNFSPAAATTTKIIQI